MELPEGAKAFVPAPLPPSLTWTPELVRVLSDADRAIGRLAGEGPRLPNPHLLIRPFVRLEAVLSSRIEGTQATLGELLAAEAGARDRKILEDHDTGLADLEGQIGPGRRQLGPTHRTSHELSLG